jgi:hypothetical protein
MSIRIDSLFFSGLCFFFRLRIGSFLTLVGIALAQPVVAQLQTYSPYSGYGFGQIRQQATSRSVGMGGVGIALADPFAIHNQNPASYPSLWLTSIDLTAFYDRSTLSDGRASSTIQTGGFQNLALVYKKTRLKDPHISRLAFTMGAMPFSKVGFSYQDTLSVPYREGTLQLFNRQEAEGGLNNVYVGAGWAPFKRVPLSVGFQGSYLFGTTVIERLATTGIGEQQVVRIDSSRYSGFLFRFGAQYGDTIKRSAAQDSLWLARRLNRHSQDSLALVRKMRPIQAEIRAIAEAPVRNPARMQRVLQAYRKDSIRLQAKRDALRQKPKKFKQQYVRMRDDSVRLAKKLKARLADRDSVRNEERLKKLYKDSAFVDFDKKRSKQFRRLDPVEWRVGATADVYSDLSTRQSQSLAYYPSGADPTRTGPLIQQYTPRVEGSTPAPPTSFSVGLGLYQHLKYTLAADFTFQNWSNYTALAAPNVGFVPYIRGGIGAEWIPDYRDIRNPLKRTAFRAGFSYEQAYIAIREQNQTYLTGTVGLGVPLAKFLPSANKRDLEKLYAFATTRLNLSAEFYTSPSAGSGFIGQTGYRLLVGVSFNEIWFSLKKYE